MSSAAIASLPPMNMPVRTPSFGGREKIASCTSPVTSSSVDVDIRQHRVEAGVERHVHVERADVRERAEHVQDVLVGHARPRFVPPFAIRQRGAGALDAPRQVTAALD